MTTREPVQSTTSIMQLIDRYARTYHRWANQPGNAELDAERKQVRAELAELLERIEP